MHAFSYVCFFVVGRKDDFIAREACRDRSPVRMDLPTKSILRQFNWPCIRKKLLKSFSKGLRWIAFRFLALVVTNKCASKDRLRPIWVWDIR
jgi:hypothetical protein